MQLSQSRRARRIRVRRRGFAANTPSDEPGIPTDESLQIPRENIEPFPIEEL